MMQRIRNYPASSCVAVTGLMLLISYVMYALAGALDDWQKNYSQDINRLQLIQEVKTYADREAGKQGTV